MAKIQITVQLNDGWEEVDLAFVANHLSEGTDNRLDGLFPDGDKDWATTNQIIHGE